MTDQTEREALIEEAFDRICRDEPLSPITRADIGKWVDLFQGLGFHRTPTPHTVTNVEAVQGDIERIVERVTEYGYANDAEGAEWRADIRDALTALVTPTQPVTVTAEQVKAAADTFYFRFHDPNDPTRTPGDPVVWVEDLPNILRTANLPVEGGE